MTSHAKFLDLAAAAIDFGLSPSDRAGLDAHLAACPPCARSAHDLRTDAIAFGHLPSVVLPNRRGAEILAAAMHPTSTRHPLRLVLVAALLALLALGSLVAGAELLRGEGDLVIVPSPSVPAVVVNPSPTASSVPSASPAAAEEPFDPAHAGWDVLGAVPGSGTAGDATLGSVVGFAGGYAATGSVDGKGSVAWYSEYGTTWTSAPLANLVVNCPGYGPPGDDMVPDAEARAIATNGSEIVIVGETSTYGAACPQLQPVAWHSTDGRTWQRSTPFDTTGAGPGTDLRATAVWAIPGGWQASSDTSTWESADGLAWRKVGDPVSGAEVAASAPDGSVVAVRQATDTSPSGLFLSRDGRTWTPVAAPDGCGVPRGIVPPSASGLDAWVLLGDLKLCASRDLETWSVDTTEVAWYAGAQTRFGAIVVGDTCFGAGSNCTPDPRAYLTTDGVLWTPMVHPPIWWGRTIADGSNGVMIIGSGTADGGSTTAWGLTTGFVPPAAICPAPATAVDPPTMTVAVGTGKARPADMGPATVTTCSTVRSDDRPLPVPKAPLAAASGNVLVFSVSPGWQLRAWSASDRSRNGDGGAGAPATASGQQGSSVEVTIFRSGDSIISLSAWAVRDDGRAIAEISTVAWVHVP